MFGRKTLPRQGYITVCRGNAPALSIVQSQTSGLQPQRFFRLQARSLLRTFHAPRTLELVSYGVMPHTPLKHKGGVITVSAALIQTPQRWSVHTCCYRSFPAVDEKPT